jgi:ElaB/YqjD/DUF883 family membrane-anchored ribosome-binding protein
MISEPNASDGTVEGRKEKLVTDLRGVIANAETLLNELATSTAEEFDAVRTKIEGTLSGTKSRLADAGSAVADKARVAADATQEYVTENPWRVLGVAAVAGLLIGLLMSLNRR